MEGWRSGLAVFTLAWSASSSMIRIGQAASSPGRAPRSHRLSALSRAPFFLTTASTRWFWLASRASTLSVGRKSASFVRRFHISMWGCLELCVQSFLCLLAKRVVDTGKDDEEPVAGIGGLCDHRGEVGGLAALDVAEN